MAGRGPPYGYRIADAGPHPNPSKAASGARLHQLEVDPETAPVVRRIFAMYLAGAGYRHIASTLTRELVASPSANDPTRNRHRPGHAWAMSAVRAILANPRYLGHHVSGRTKKADLLLDPNLPTLGHVTRQQWQDKASWVTSKAQAYTAIVDEETWRRVQALASSNTRTTAVTPSRRLAHDGTRRSVPSRYPLAGLVICECCGKRLQGNIARGLAFYRCKASTDYPLLPPGHPASLAVREDRLLPHVDTWLAKMFAPENIVETARQVVEADAQANREDPAISRARATLVDCERKSPGTSTAWKPAYRPTSSPLGSLRRSGRRRRPRPCWQGLLRHPNLSLSTKWWKP